MRRLNVVILLLVVTIRVMSQVNIWEGVSHHKKVMMTPYLANSDGKSIAIIVCPEVVIFGTILRLRVMRSDGGCKRMEYRHLS